MTIDIEALKKAAEAAGGEQWTNGAVSEGGSRDVVWGADGDGVAIAYHCIGHMPEALSAEDIAAYIAASNPATILALIAEVEQARRDKLELQRRYDEQKLQEKRLEVALQRGHAAQPVAAPAWISVKDRLPEVGVLVMVFVPPSRHEENHDIRFDCIDPNDDDAASWYDHNEHYEHFCCVAKPAGTIGPSAEDPYTHWMPLPAAPEVK